MLARPADRLGDCCFGHKVRIASAVSRYWESFVIQDTLIPWCCFIAGIKNVAQSSHAFARLRDDGYIFFSVPGQGSVHAFSYKRKSSFYLEFLSQISSWRLLAELLLGRVVFYLYQADISLCRVGRSVGLPLSMLAFPSMSTQSSPPRCPPPPPFRGSRGRIKRQSPPSL